MFEYLIDELIQLLISRQFVSPETVRSYKKSCPDFNICFEICIKLLNQEYDEAKELYKELMACPKSSLNLFISAILNISIKNFAEAKESLLLITDDFKYKNLIPRLLADTTIGNRDFSEAIRILHTKNDDISLVKQIFCWGELGDSVQMLINCKKLKHANSLYLSQCTIISLILKQKYEKCLQFLLSLHVTAENKLDIYFFKGYCLLNLGHIKEAISILNEVISSSNKVDVYWILLGISYGIANELEESFWCFTKCTILNPHRPDNWHNLGCLYLRSGQVLESEVLFKKASAMQMRQLSSNDFAYPVIDLSTFGKQKNEYIPPAYIEEKKFEISKPKVVRKTQKLELDMQRYRNEMFSILEDEYIAVRTLTEFASLQKRIRPD